MPNPYDNMPLLTLFSLHALAAVDQSKSPRDKAEEAFEIGKEMMDMHTALRKAPGAVQLAGVVTKKQ